MAEHPYVPWLPSSQLPTAYCVSSAGPAAPAIHATSVSGLFAHGVGWFGPLTQLSSSKTNTWLACQRRWPVAEDLSAQLTSQLNTRWVCALPHLRCLIGSALCSYTAMMAGLDDSAMACSWRLKPEVPGTPMGTLAAGLGKFVMVEEICDCPCDLRRVASVQRRWWWWRR